jgi:hypothetical protein
VSSQSLTSHQYTVSTLLHTQPFNSSSQFSHGTDTRACRISAGSPTDMTQAFRGFLRSFSKMPEQRLTVGQHRFLSRSAFVPPSDTVQSDRLTASSSRSLQCSAGCWVGGGVSGAGGRCGHVARGGCSLAWNYGVTGATVLTEMADTQTGSDKLSLHY